jgi:hypothetical protein
LIGGPHLRAVGEHLTNAEIATRLFISIRTVESHVSSLLRKFGASDRRALSLLAAERSGDPAPPPGDTPRRVAPLPSPLTSLVGWASERAESLLDGHWDSAIAAGECFREGWERAGRPRRLVVDLRRTGTAVSPAARPVPPRVLRRLVMLHRDQPGEALRLLAIPPNEIHGWYQGIWRPWYGALGWKRQCSPMRRTRLSAS